MLVSAETIRGNTVIIQLNEYKTDPYFPQFFQSKTTVCLIINVFCKICVQEREPEIVPKKSKQKTAQESKQKNFMFTFRFLVHNAYKTRKSTMSWIGNSEENMDLSHIYLAVCMCFPMCSATRHGGHLLPSQKSCQSP